jgi:adenine-specific DNA-methyltransferase
MGELISIQNRRYIGNKTALLPFIDKAIKKYYKYYDSQFSIADIFAGTGSVANYYFVRNKEVLVNDTLKSNYYPYVTWISNLEYNESKISDFIKSFNAVRFENIEDNYFSQIYGGKYFSNDVAKKVGLIRDQIELSKNDLSLREYAILITSLLYASDKNANTVGHYEHYLKNNKPHSEFTLSLPKITSSEVSSIISNEDANILVKKISPDIVYIDPPYNSRQYINFYHVLENLARWDKPTEFEGKSMKFKRDKLKSDYSKAKAPQVFKDLISHLKCKLIVMSYNNTYGALSSASNNKISEEFIIETLSTKGIIHIEESNYRYFNSGKTNFVNHKEKLYICEVNNV